MRQHSGRIVCNQSIDAGRFGARNPCGIVDGPNSDMKTCITRLRNIESVFDAYRVTPTV